MPELQQFQKRQVAHKVMISDIVNGSFAKDELSAGYIKLNNVNISRVNVLATIVHKSEGAYANSVIDDGTGKIQLRAFENTNIFSKADVGDFILVIGKIREFSNERYILPEILKKTDVRWMAARKLELKSVKAVVDNIDKNINDGDLIEKEDSAADDIYLLIKKLDNGDGASVDELIKSANGSNTEGIINKLMKNGDIFEIKPGRLKVLE